MNSDISQILQWWGSFLVIGALFVPLSTTLFNKFYDKGYIFSKIIGIGIISYISFVLGTLRLVPFSNLSIYAILAVVAIADYFLIKKGIFRLEIKDLKIFLFQEIVFFLGLIFWCYIKSFQPDIHGLEKYMDFGFMNSILRSTYFPPKDMWFPPDAINYYYFGHLYTAVMIKTTQTSPYVAFNLMLSTIFAFTVTCSFSLVSTFTQAVLKMKKTSILAGLLAGVLTSLGGNLHTIYALFTPYVPAENPVPFWQLKFLPLSFPNNYWYPNATRFIPFTIHEFPSYSFVVSDLHGHVLDIPFVFLSLAIIYSVFLYKKITFRVSILVGFMMAIMYMTNAWDGIIYLLLFTMTILLWRSDILKSSKTKTYKFMGFSFAKVINKKNYLVSFLKYLVVTCSSFFIFSLPFSIGFKPFVSGIGVLCSPGFLVNIGKIGPFLFEANHCQRTPFWMLIVLYGFFYFFSITLVLKIISIKKTPPTLIFILLIILLSTILIATPEFIYAKDIYPAHYRANTMFKLGYQAFIMLSLVSSFSVAYLLHRGRKVIWIPVCLVLLVIVLIYPYFAINSYFGNLKTQQGLNGLSYLRNQYPDDYDAILWIQKYINGQPVILESQGDSYTDYGRISANTGLLTPLGWTVHEWLWRGDYSYPQSRLADISTLFEGPLTATLTLIKKYNISYVYIGTLERTKYPNLNEDKFKTIGKVIYKSKNSTIYKIQN